MVAPSLLPCFVVTPHVRSVNCVSSVAHLAYQVMERACGHGAPRLTRANTPTRGQHSVTEPFMNRFSLFSHSSLPFSIFLLWILHCDSHNGTEAALFLSLPSQSGGPGQQQRQSSVSASAVCLLAAAVAMLDRQAPGVVPVCWWWRCQHLLPALSHFHSLSLSLSLSLSFSKQLCSTQQNRAAERFQSWVTRSMEKNFACDLCCARAES